MQLMNIPALAWLLGFSVIASGAGAAEASAPQHGGRDDFFPGGARGRCAVSANEGSYLLPDASMDFPYGFGGSGPGETGLRAALGLPLTVLLGTANTDPNHKDLPRSPEAEAQGPFRLARGEFFFAQGKKAAAAMGVPFRWTLSLAPGVGHSDKDMAPFAVKCYFPE